MESHMTNQERTLSILLEQAMKIRDDVVTGLRATQGSVLMESSARKLLENHIQIITHIVKQLSRDIQVLIIIIFICKNWMDIYNTILCVFLPWY